MVSVLHQVQYSGNRFNSVPGMILTFVFFPHFGQSRYLPVFSILPPAVGVRWETRAKARQHDFLHPLMIFHVPDFPLKFPLGCLQPRIYNPTTAVFAQAPYYWCPTVFTVCHVAPFPPIGADGRGRTFTLLLTRQPHRLLCYVSKCKILLFLIFQSPFAKGPGLFSGTPPLSVSYNYYKLFRIVKFHLNFVSSAKQERKGSARLCRLY